MHIYIYITMSRDKVRFATKKTVKTKWIWAYTKKKPLEYSLVNMTGTFNEDVGRYYIHVFR